MKLSKRGEYALRALIDLGVAQELGRPLFSLGELSAKENIPATFLERIFLRLRPAGIVGSSRAKRAKLSSAFVPPAKLSVLFSDAAPLPGGGERIGRSRRRENHAAIQT